jgi:hypothetical protein
VVANIEGQTFDGGAYHGEFLCRLVHRATDQTGYWTSDLTSTSIQYLQMFLY